MKTKKTSRIALKNKAVLEGGLLARALAHAERVKPTRRGCGSDAVADRCVALILKKCVAYASELDGTADQKRAFFYCLHLAADKLKSLAVSGDIP